MNDRRHDPDERLAHWLRTTHAELDPALWTRVRARLETAGDRRGWLAWLTRPAALATSIGALAVATSWSLLLVDGASREATLANETTTSLTDALLAVGSSPVDGLLSPSPACFVLVCCWPIPPGLIVADADAEATMRPASPRCGCKPA